MSSSESGDHRLADRVGLGLVVAILAIGCASNPTPIETPLPISTPTLALGASPAPTPTPTATPNPSQVAGLGFRAWLADRSKTMEAGVDGTDAGFIPMFGSIVITSTGTYQLLTAEGATIFAYERNSMTNPSTRTTGAPYRPKPATLTVAERFGDALAASNGWTDLGLDRRDGQALDHLRAATSGLTDAGLFVDTHGGVITSPPGQLDAWVQADGRPVILAYAGSDVQLTFHIQSDPSASPLGHLFLDPSPTGG